jgi:hypothetical protein
MNNETEDEYMPDQTVQYPLEDYIWKYLRLGYVIIFIPFIGGTAGIFGAFILFLGWTSYYYFGFMHRYKTLLLRKDGVRITYPLSMLKKEVVLKYAEIEVSFFSRTVLITMIPISISSLRTKRKYE